jgi:hypothetical protein
MYVIIKVAKKNITVFDKYKIPHSASSFQDSIQLDMYVCIYSQAHLAPEHENKFLIKITN